MMTELLQMAGTNRSLSVNRRLVKVTAVAVVGAACAAAITLALTQPRADRRWIPQHAVMAHADVRRDSAHLHRIRNFTYATEDQFTAAYADRR
jgi:hypothetical protein